MDNQVKIAVLEQKIEDLKPIVLRIDTAIQKLSEVNTTVSRMLAVHEERISKQEEIDTVLFTKIDKLSNSQLQNNISAYKSHLLEKGWESAPPLFEISAKTGQGKKEILNYIQSINSNL